MIYIIYDTVFTLGYYVFSMALNGRSKSTYLVLTIHYGDSEALSICIFYDTIIINIFELSMDVLKIDLYHYIRYILSFFGFVLTKVSIILIFS